MQKSIGPAPSLGVAPYGEAPPELYEASRWYACRTRSRAEKKVESLFARSGIEGYLPLVVQERQWADRRKRVALPLLPGYLFARFQLGKIGEVLRTPGVVAVAEPNGYPTPVREEELEAVRCLVSGVNETGRVPSSSDFLESGEEVMVQDGPFQGMRGILTEKRGKRRVVIRISALRHAISIEMERELLRAAPSRM